MFKAFESANWDYPYWSLSIVLIVNWTSASKWSLIRRLVWVTCYVGPIVVVHTELGSPQLSNSKTSQVLVRNIKIWNRSIEIALHSFRHYWRIAKSSISSSFSPLSQNTSNFNFRSFFNLIWGLPNFNSLVHWKLGLHLDCTLIYCTIFFCCTWSIIIGRVWNINSILVERFINLWKILSPSEFLWTGRVWHDFLFWWKCCSRNISFSLNFYILNIGALLSVIFLLWFWLFLVIAEWCKVIHYFNNVAIQPFTFFFLTILNFLLTPSSSPEGFESDPALILPPDLSLSSTSFSSFSKVFFKFLNI